MSFQTFFGMFAISLSGHDYAILRDVLARADQNGDVGETIMRRAFLQVANNGGGLREVAALFDNLLAEAAPPPTTVKVINNSVYGKMPERG